MLLREVALQGIHLELLRRVQDGNLIGQEVADTLLEHQDLWRAAILGGFVAERLDLADAYLLARLRGLRRDQVEGLDTLYVLANDYQTAQELTRRIRRSSKTFDLDPRRWEDYHSIPESNRVIKLWWNRHRTTDPSTQLTYRDSVLDRTTLHHHDHLDLGTCPAQSLYLELLRRREFNAYHGQEIFEGLLGHDDCWEAVILDSLSVAFIHDSDAHMLRKLLGILDGGGGPADALHILTANRDAAEVLLHQAWASEPSIRKADRLNRFGELAPEQCLINMWWD